MRKILTDLLKHTLPLNTFEILNVKGNDECTMIESLSGDKTIIFKAYLKNNVPEFSGEFGIGNLGILKGLLNFAPFKSENSTITVKKELRNDEDVPIRIIFTDEDKRPAHFALVSKDVLPPQPKMVDLNWEVKIEPTTSKIKELMEMASIFSSTEDFFHVKTKDNELRFYIGDEEKSNHHSYVVFSKDINNGECSGLNWYISQILSILKLIDNNTLNTSISISNKGAMQISLETENAVYYYNLPASLRI